MISNPAERLAGLRSFILYLIPIRCTDKFLSNILIILFQRKAFQPIHDSHINTVVIHFLTFSDSRKILWTQLNAGCEICAVNLIVMHDLAQCFAK